MSIGKLRDRKLKRSPPPQSRRPRTPQMGEKKLRHLLEPLEEAAEERDELKQQWLEASQRTNELALEASAANVPTSMVTKSARFTSQYLYQIEKAEAAKLNGAKLREHTKPVKRATGAKKTNAHQRISKQKRTKRSE